MNRIKFISLTSLCAWALLVSCGCGKAAQRTDPSAEPSLEPSEDPSPDPSEEPSAEPVFTRYQRDQILHSQVLDTDIRYSVLLPRDYEESPDRRYPVVYMLHGLGDDQNSWNGDWLHAAERIKLLEGQGLEDMIYVYPMGYQCYYVNKFDGSFPYMDMFVQELVPHIDATWRTVADKQHRCITGYSMGGFGAWVLAGKNPDLFCASAPLSMSFRTDAQYMTESSKGWNSQWGGIFGGKGETGPARLTDYYKAHCPYYVFAEENRPGLESVKWFFTCGDDEEQLLIANDSLHVLLRDRGFAHEYRVNNGGHTSTYWMNSLDEVLPMFSFYMNGGTSWPGKSLTVPEVPDVERDPAGAWKSERYAADGTGTVLYVFHEAYPGISDVVAVLSLRAEYAACAIVPWDISLHQANRFAEAAYPATSRQALAIGTAGDEVFACKEAFAKLYFFDASTPEAPQTASGEDYVILNTDDGTFYRCSGALYASCKRSGADFQYRVAKGTGDKAADLLRCLDNYKSLFTF